MTTFNLCNGCDDEPMAPGQDAPGQPGYCAGCLEQVVSQGSWLDDGEKESAS